LGFRHPAGGVMVSPAIRLLISALALCHVSVVVLGLDVFPAVGAGLRGCAVLWAFVLQLIDERLYDRWNHSAGVRVARLVAHGFSFSCVAF
jgi:hypothetical protein